MGVMLSGLIEDRLGRVRTHRVEPWKSLRNEMEDH